MGVPAYALAPIGGSAQGIGTLNPAHETLTFHDQFTNPTPLPGLGDPVPTLCVTTCQKFTFDIAGAIRSPVLVSIKWGSMDDGLDLYVYDSAGNEVGSANGIGSDGQAVRFTPNGNGPYTIGVTETYAYDQTAAYDGEVRVLPTPACATAAPCALLPQLAVVAPTDVRVDGVPPVASTPLGFPFPVDMSTGNSCYLDETANVENPGTAGPQRCLRFTSDIRNAGTGDLQLRVPWVDPNSTDHTSGFVNGQCEAQQVVTYSDGTTQMRDAGPCEFHLEHMHFHYNEFAEFALYKVNSDGSRGEQVSQSLKESFCLADDDYFAFGTPTNGPRSYSGQPGCSVASTVGPDGAWVNMGITPGWGDVYTWDTPDQYIDITNVPAGYYDIVTIANPHGDLAVAGDPSPTASTRIHLTATDVQTCGGSVTCP